MNYDIPALHNFHFLERLISAKQIHNIPLLATSIDAGESRNEQNILDKGVSATFSEPLDITVFLKKLEQLMPHKKYIS